MITSYGLPSHDQPIGKYDDEIHIIDLSIFPQNRRNCMSSSYIQKRKKERKKERNKERKRERKKEIRHFK